MITPGVVKRCPDDAQSGYGIPSSFDRFSSVFAGIQKNGTTSSAQFNDGPSGFSSNGRGKINTADERSILSDGSSPIKHSRPINDVWKISRGSFVWQPAHVSAGI